MERETWARGGMVLSALALIVLILATPSLLGRPSPELASLPLLIIGMNRNETMFIVNLYGAVQAYRYDQVRLSMNGTDPSVNGTIYENETFGLHTWVPANVTRFTVDAYLIDQQGNYFEYNVTTHTEKDTNNRTVMVFTFPDEKNNPGMQITRTPPEDFRWLIPWRGTLP